MTDPNIDDKVPHVDHGQVRDPLKGDKPAPPREPIEKPGVDHGGGDKGSDFLVLTLPAGRGLSVNHTTRGLSVTNSDGKALIEIPIADPHRLHFSVDPLDPEPTLTIPKWPIPKPGDPIPPDADPIDRLPPAFPKPKSLKALNYFLAEVEIGAGAMGGGKAGEPRGAATGVRDARPEPHIPENPTKTDHESGAGVRITIPIGGS